MLAQRKKTGLRINHYFLHSREHLMICWRHLREKMRAHSCQAPTLIGCSIVKERVLRHPHDGAVKSLPSAGRCVAAAPEAEKRDYEAVFLVCQARAGNFKLQNFALPGASPRRLTKAPLLRFPFCGIQNHNMNLANRKRAVSGSPLRPRGLAPCRALKRQTSVLPGETSGKP